MTFEKEKEKYEELLPVLLFLFIGCVFCLPYSL